MPFWSLVPTRYREEMAAKEMLVGEQASHGTSHKDSLSCETLSCTYHDAVASGNDGGVQKCLVFIQHDHSFVRNLPRIAVNVRCRRVSPRTKEECFRRVTERLQLMFGKSRCLSKSFLDNMIDVDITRESGYDSGEETFSSDYSLADHSETSTASSSTQSCLSAHTCSPSRQQRQVRRLFEDDGSTSVEFEPLQSQAHHALSRLESSDSWAMDYMEESFDLEHQTRGSPPLPDSVSSCSRTARFYVVHVLTNWLAVVSINRHLMLLSIHNFLHFSPVCFRKRLPLASSGMEPGKAPSQSELTPSKVSPVSNASSTPVPISSTHSSLHRAFDFCEASPITRSGDGMIDPCYPHSRSAIKTLGTCPGGVIYDSTSNTAYSIGGNNRDGMLASIDAYSTSEKRWREGIGKLRHSWANGGAALLNDGSIYLVGGTSRAERTQPAICTVLKSPPLSSGLNGRWKTVSSLRIARISPSVAAVNNGKCMLVAGGRDQGGNTLMETEIYGASTNCWNFVAPMHMHRSSSSIATLDDKVYVCGGESATNIMIAGPLACAECYDIGHDRWTKIAPMDMQRRSSAACALHKRIYVTGGVGISSSLSIVEAYDPREGKWQVLAPLSRPRSCHGIFSLPDRDSLAVVGGYDGRAYLNDIEWFDIRSPGLSHVL